MQLKSALIAAMALLATQILAAPAETGGEINMRQSCGVTPGSCFENGCDGTFTNPSDRQGTCQGAFQGCVCNKCGTTNGACDQNGCEGESGVCTAGLTQGCPCDG